MDYTWDRHGIVINVMVGPQGVTPTTPIRALLDTGASATAIRTSHATMAGLPFLRMERVSDPIAGIVTVPHYAAMIRFSLGARAYCDFSVDVAGLELRAVNADALIG